MTATARFVVGDVFEQLAKLPDQSVDLVLTSPPFLALRSYLPDDHPDKAREIGTEPTPAEYLDTLLALSAEFRRVVTPRGSIAVELGDTYSGSGGAGGDYARDGLRSGQPTFRQAAPKRTARPNQCATDGAAGARVKNSGGHSWPLPKSLVGIPHLYHLSLAYGRNILTGGPSPAGEWRVRNVVAWCRPNPPVGRLGDKFRPGTSYMTIAAVAGDRYFDLDAVRRPNPRIDEVATVGRKASAQRVAGGDNGRPGKVIRQNPNGAPPLDWWQIPTQPYRGAHYATWPPALLDRPILAMCPPGGTVLDPFAGSGTTLMVAVGHGRNAIGIDIDERNLELAKLRVGEALVVDGPDPVAEANGCVW